MKGKFCRIVVPFMSKEIKKMEKKRNKALDAIDIKILNELQRNGKISNIDLSKKSGAFANTLFRAS